MGLSYVFADDATRCYLDLQKLAPHRTEEPSIPPSDDEETKIGPWVWEYERKLDDYTQTAIRSFIERVGEPNLDRVRVISDSDYEVDEYNRVFATYARVGSVDPPRGASTAGQSLAVIVANAALGASPNEGKAHACTHEGTTVDLYSSHGGGAEWCWRCGSARSSSRTGESYSDWVWLPVGSNPDAPDVEAEETAP